MSDHDILEALARLVLGDAPVPGDGQKAQDKMLLREWLSQDEHPTRVTNAERDAAKTERERCIAIIKSGCGFEIAEHLVALIRGYRSKAPEAPTRGPVHVGDLTEAFLRASADRDAIRRKMISAFGMFMNEYRGETVLPNDTLTPQERTELTRYMSEIRVRWIREALRDRDVAVLRWAADRLQQASLSDLAHDVAAARATIP